jgi:hypothetical protein
MSLILISLNLIYFINSFILHEDTLPSQIHISIAGTNSVRINWKTQSATPSHVKWGINPSKLNSDFSTTEECRYYLSQHGFHHSVLLTNLPSNKQIFYSCGNDEGGWNLGNLSFRSPPNKDDPVKIAIFGDWGYLDSKRRPLVVPAVEDLVKNWSAQFTWNSLSYLISAKNLTMIWHAGDIAYVDDSFAHNLLFSYEKIYDKFIEWIEPFASTIPYMVSVGNHEAECHSPACLIERKKYAIPLSNFSAYNSRWRMPSLESHSSGLNMWYSFPYSSLHMVSINTETDFPGAGEEHYGEFGKLPSGGFGREGEYLNWLENDLKTAAESRRLTGSPKWIIAVGHRPRDDIPEHLKLFEKYEVDIYFCGHTHSYKRLEKVNGVTYIVVGGAGNDETDISFPNKKTTQTQKEVVFATSRPAIGVLTVNITHLFWELLDGLTHNILDNLTLLKF